MPSRWHAIAAHRHAADLGGTADRPARVARRTPIRLKLTPASTSSMRRGRAERRPVTGHRDRRASRPERRRSRGSTPRKAAVAIGLPEPARPAGGRCRRRHGGVRRNRRRGRRRGGRFRHRWYLKRGRFGRSALRRSPLRSGHIRHRRLCFTARRFAGTSRGWPSAAGSGAVGGTAIVGGTTPDGAAGTEAGSWPGAARAGRGDQHGAGAGHADERAADDAGNHLAGQAQALEPRRPAGAALPRCGRCGRPARSAGKPRCRRRARVLALAATTVPSSRTQQCRPGALQHGTRERAQRLLGRSGRRGGRGRRPGRIVGRRAHKVSVVSSHCGGSTLPTIVPARPTRHARSRSRPHHRCNGLTARDQDMVRES